MHSYLGFSYIIKRFMIFSFGIYTLLIYVKQTNEIDNIVEFHHFAVPLVLSVLINIYLPKIGKEHFITPLGIGLFFISFGISQGTLLHTLIMSTSTLILLLNSIRPWNT